MRRRPLGSPPGSLRAAALIALVGPAGLGAQEAQGAQGVRGAQGLRRPTVVPDAADAVALAVDVTPLAPTGPALATITPAFSWSVDDSAAFGTPITYRLRIGRDSALTIPLVDTVTTASGYALSLPLKPGRPLFWRIDATGSTGLEATTGVVGPITVPPWATLTALSAPEGVNTADAQPTLSWRSPGVSAPPGPFRYDLVVHRAAAPFANVPEVSVAGLRDTVYQVPQPLERHVGYLWSLVVHAGTDTSVVRSAGPFMVVDGSTPPATVLYQNFPNPFPAGGQESTCLWFDLAVAVTVELEILDLRGNAVRRFVPGPELAGILPAGRYGRGGPGGPTCDARLMWDGRAHDGRDVPPGVYLYKLKAGGIIQFRRIVFRGRGH